MMWVSGRLPYTLKCTCTCTWKTIKTTCSVHTGLGIFWVCYVFFQIQPCPAANPLLTGQQFFWNLGLVGLVPNSMSVSSRDEYLGQYVDICLLVFFQHDVEKILVCYGYIQIWWEIWQHLWPDLGALSRLPICPTSGRNSSFRDCRRMSEPGVVKGFKQPFAIKKQNTQLNKKTSVAGKTHNGQKKCPYGFPGIYIYVRVFMYIYIL